MIRKTLLALTAAIGMIGGNELTTSTAEAQGQFKLGVAGKNGAFSLNIGNYGYGYGGGYYAANYLYPPLVVAPTCQYTVFVRTCAYEPWQVYGTFLSHVRAHDAMNFLRSRGLETYEIVR